MPPTLTLTWQEALIRGPDFRRIDERDALKLQKAEFVSAQRKSDHDLTTVTAERDAARKVININNQDYMACVAQINHYRTLCTHPPLKTIEQYTEYINEIQSLTATQEGYDIRHGANNLASNALYARSVHIETELTAAKTATNTFRVDYASRIQTFRATKQVAKDAFMTEMGEQKEAVPSERWEVQVSQSLRHLHPYAMKTLMWVVYFNGFYARQKFCTLMGLADTHHHVRYAMYILEEFGIISRRIHGNSESLYGLSPALQKLVKSNTAPIAMVNQFLREGHKIKGARKVALAETKRANKASRKRKHNATTNGKKAAAASTAKFIPKADDVLNDKDTEDNEAAAGNRPKAPEAPSSPESSSAIYDL